MVRTAGEQALVHWYDDVQADETSIFERDDMPILLDTVACRWVAENPAEARAALKANLATQVHLGNAVLAGYLDLKDAVPDLVDAMTKDDSDVAYSGESPIEGEPELGYFRGLQGMAYVVEHLTGKRLAEVRLSADQTQRLKTRAASEEGEAAKALLAAFGVGP